MGKLVILLNVMAVLVPLLAVIWFAKWFRNGVIAMQAGARALQDIAENRDRGRSS